MADRGAGSYISRMSKLAEKVAIVTGGSSGIGLAIARRFVAEGAHVFITGRRQPELDAAARLIERNVTTVQGDAGNADDLDRLYATVKKEKGKVDIVIANAGTIEHMSLADATPEHFDRTFDLNVRGTFFTVQKSLPILADGGAVVLVASALTAKGLPGTGAYAASKAAIRSFARTTIRPGTAAIPDIKLEYFLTVPTGEKVLHIVADVPIDCDPEIIAALFDAIVDSIRWFPDATVVPGGTVDAG